MLDFTPPRALSLRVGAKSRALGLVAFVLFGTSVLTSASADQIVLVAGGGTSEASAKAQDAVLKEPFGCEFDEKGGVWLVEMVSGNRLLKIDKDGVLSHVAGRLQPGLTPDGADVLDSQFNGPHNLAVLSPSRVLIADTWNGLVREVDLALGRTRALPGYGVSPERAKANGPYCICLDDAKAKLYIADLKQVWALDLQSNVLKLVAGNGKRGIPLDGALAVDEPLQDPRAVAPDHAGNVYILERGGNALRVVDSSGKIRTVVNLSGKAGIQGDGGPAADAQLNGPKHLCVDRDNSVLIADAENHLIRRYVPRTGRIERVAGTGEKGAAGIGGEPEKCQLARPHGVSVHPTTGELYITDSYNHRILRIKRS